MPASPCIRCARGRRTRTRDVWRVPLQSATVEFGGAAVELLPVVGPADGAEFAGVLAANPGEELLGELLGELLAEGAFLTPGFSSGAGVAARGVPGRDPDDRGFQLSCKKLSMNSDEFSPVPDSASCISPGAGTAVPPGPTNGGSPASGFLAGLSAFAGFVAGGASTGFKSGWPLANSQGRRRFILMLVGSRYHQPHRHRCHWQQDARVKLEETKQALSSPSLPILPRHASFQFGCNARCLPRAIEFTEYLSDPEWLCAYLPDQKSKAQKWP